MTVAADHNRSVTEHTHSQIELREYTDDIGFQQDGDISNTDRTSTTYVRSSEESFYLALEMYNSQLIPYSFFYGGTLQFCLQY